MGDYNRETPEKLKRNFLWALSNVLMTNNLNSLLQYNLTPIIFQEEEEEIKLEVNVLKTVGQL